MALRAPLAGLVVAVLVAFGYAGAAVPGLDVVIAVGLPYAAILLFTVGVILRVARWGRAPVPFRIPTTCGQQRSLPWIRTQPLDNPSSGLATVGRMALEILAFRSLFRNTRSVPGEQGRLAHIDQKWLWLGAMVFHWSLLLVLTRHLRFFLDPVPAAIDAVARLDGFFQIGVPALFLSSAGIVAGLAFLTWRRFSNPQVRHVSLAADYFPLFLLLGIAATGILMRHFTRTDVVAAKQLALGLVTFRPHAPADLAPMFGVHLTLVSVLLAYFPMSKLTHMAGVFLSPTRNLANTSRMVRHVNPWNPKVKTHTYEEWEEEFRGKLESAGIPLDRPAPEEPPRATAAPGG